MARGCVSPFEIVLTALERRELEGRARSYTASYAQVVRAKIVLFAAEGMANVDIALRLDTSPQVVHRWRKRFFEQRLKGLEDAPRSGRPRIFPPSVNAELTEHVGYVPYDPAGHNSGNSRNGSRSKTVITDIGPICIDVPRDRDGSFEPQLVRKRQRRLGGVDALVCSLSAKGLTHGEIAAHLKEIYGAEVSKETITRITDRVLEGMTEWQNRPLDRLYPVIFIDAIVVKIREGQVANRPIYVALGVTTDGERDILGLWAGDGGEGAKYWHHVLTEIKNRGVGDCCIVVCDGLTGLPDAVSSVWPRAIVQTCVIHLLRNSFRYASRRDWPAIAKALKPIYTAPTEAAALERLAEFAEVWEGRYPAIVKLWESAWAEFVPFLSFDPEIRTIIYTTNAIESLNARFRRAVKARGHFPTEQAAMKCLYLTVMSLDPTGKGRQRWTNRWKPALNASQSPSKDV